jgi:hypothetical protein
MSGCVVQLEILRALTRLIGEGALPRPRRAIVFLWPQEISGTYEQIKRTDGFADRFSVNINMDMVGEGLRKNNSVMTMSECPNYLPSYLDGLADAVMNYVWRTNDIVYTGDSPRGRPGAAVPARPLWEKNGSRDAFRFFIHRATGGSDHTCFVNPAVAVPAIEFFTWPDQWYHADTDTPDKSDPTQMRRIAFIGAAAAWAAANCDDAVLPELLRSVSAFGYARVGQRELSRALQMVTESEAKDLEKAMNRALGLTALAAAREKGAVESVREVYSGSDKARAIVAAQVRQWELYGASLDRQVREFAAYRAAALGAKAPAVRPFTAEEKRAGAAVPALAPGIKGREFSLYSSERSRKYAEAHPDAVKGLKLTPPQRRVALNYIDGRRTIAEIGGPSDETGRRSRSGASPLTSTSSKPSAGSARDRSLRRSRFLILWPSESRSMDPENQPKIEFEAPVILDRGRHRIPARNRSRLPQGPLPAERPQLRRLPRRRGVRDLMLGRRPADFDVGTNAYPTRSRSSSATPSSSAGASGWPTSGSRAARSSRSRPSGGSRTRRSWPPSARRKRPAPPKPPRSWSRRRGGHAPGRRRRDRRRRGRPPSTHRLRHAPRGRLPPRPDGQRPVLRHRHLLRHRLRRRARRP